TLERGAYVYPVSVQWRTAHVLFEAGTINAPYGLRALIEAVHGEDDMIPVPAALENAELQTIGKEFGDAHQAQDNIVPWNEGYRKGKGLEDADYPTRQGQEQRTLLLVRCQDDRCLPWGFGQDGTQEQLLALSEVRASAVRLK